MSDHPASSQRWKNPSEQWDHYFKRELETEAAGESWELLLELAGKYGVEWVWENRKRLVDLMRYFVLSNVAVVPSGAHC